MEGDEDMREYMFLDADTDTPVSILKASSVFSKSWNSFITRPPFWNMVLSNPRFSRDNATSDGIVLLFDDVVKFDLIWKKNTN